MIFYINFSGIINITAKNEASAIKQLDYILNFIPIDKHIINDIHINEDAEYAEYNRLKEKYDIKSGSWNNQYSEGAKPPTITFDIPLKRDIDTI